MRIEAYQSGNPLTSTQVLKDPLTLAKVATQISLLNNDRLLKAMLVKFDKMSIIYKDRLLSMYDKFVAAFEYIVMNDDIYGKDEY